MFLHRRAPCSPPAPRSSVAIATALVALILGGLTSWAQLLLPPWISSFSNSAGGWTMIVFLVVWVGRSKPVFGAVLGVLAFEGLNEGYGIVSGWRGGFYSEPFSNIWTILGLIAGPIVGASASLTRHASPGHRAVWVAPLCAVLLGEGVYGLVDLHAETSPVYWIIEIVLSVAFLGAAAWRARSWTWNAGAAGLSLLGATVFFLIYRQG